MKKLITMAVVSACISMPAMAAEKSSSKPLLNKSDVSIGAGIANNTIDLPAPFSDQDETGFQFFAGFNLRKVNLMEGVNTSVEAGYMDYGFDTGGNSGGLWATAVVDGTISGTFGWLGRVGFDFGDDDGLMFGAGLSLDLGTKTELRGEYVIRDNIDSLQLNLVYHL